MPAATFSPYSSFTGGVRVAQGDFDGDGNDELVTAAGPSGGPHVIIWDVNSDGSIGPALDSFFAYGTSFTGGLFVATGDLNGDGIDELVTAPDVGGGPHVKIFSDTNRDGRLSDNLVDQFFPFGSFTGGVRVALGNTNNIGGDELIVAAGPGGGPHVLIFTDSDADRAVSDHPVLDQLFAYAVSFTGGVYVASGAIQGAGSGGAELITGPGPGSAQPVKIFSDANSNGTLSEDALFDQLSPYGAFTGGVRVAAGDTDNSSFFVEVITVPGPGGGPHVKIFDDTADVGALLSDNPETDSFFAYDVSNNKGLFPSFGKVNNGIFSLNSVPQTIADSSTLNTSIFVPASAGKIIDLDVAINAFHSFDGDLDVTLTHVPSGIAVILFQDVGGSNEGFFIRLNDEAGTDISGATNPKIDGAINGTFNPGGAALLGAFDTLDASGEWRLTIVDDSGGDSGTLFGWSLIVTY